jgi:hypothetical protein
MVTANIAFPLDVRPARRRTPLRERLSTGGAAALSIIGIIAAMGIATLALLIVPVAAALVFGPALLELI